jgi:hypothetical protein
MLLDILGMDSDSFLVLAAILIIAEIIILFQVIRYASRSNTIVKLLRIQIGIARRIATKQGVEQSEIDEVIKQAEDLL